MFYRWIYWLCNYNTCLVEKEFLKLTQSYISTKRLIQKIILKEGNS